MYVAGVFADYACQFLDRKSDAEFENLNRPAFVKSMVANRLFLSRADLGAQKISVAIDGDHIKVLEINNGGCAMEVLHSLRFFGRNTENIVIELSDEYGRVR